MTPTPTTDSQLSSAIAAERRELAAILADLPAQSWQMQSLCDGWRVREVVAHMTMPFRYALPRFAIELARSGGNFTKMSNRCAHRDADVAAEVLVAALADNAGHRWKPPGGGFAGALCHDVIHGLDFTLPLGIGRRVPEDRLRPVLRAITEPRTLKYFGADLDGIELCADDIEWSFGSGAVVSGAAQDLALVICGRTLPVGRLHGELGARFSAS